MGYSSSQENEKFWVMSVLLVEVPVFWPEVSGCVLQSPRAGVSNPIGSNAKVGEADGHLSEGEMPVKSIRKSKHEHRQMDRQTDRQGTC